MGDMEDCKNDTERKDEEENKEDKNEEDDEEDDYSQTNSSHSSNQKGDNQALRIVLLGKTGSGKSSSANTILGKSVFKSAASPSSVTKECQTARKSRFGKKIMLIDTPGVFDTDTPTEQILLELSKCIDLSLPGPHVFLLVIQIGRFTAEEVATVKKIAETFGEDVYEHIILLFTRRDSLDAEGTSLDEFLEKVKPELKEIVSKCNKRCIAINNSSKNEIDARKITEMIEELLKSNHGRHYTNKMFREAEKKRQETEEKMRVKLEKEKQKKIDEMKQQFFKEIQAKEQQMDKLLEQTKVLAEQALERENKKILKEKIRTTRKVIQVTKLVCDACPKTPGNPLTTVLKNVVLNKVFKYNQHENADLVCSLLLNVGFGIYQFAKGK